MLVIKIAVIKWLPNGLIITGLSVLVYRACSKLALHSMSATAADAYRDTLRTDTIIAWLVVVLFTLGLQLYGEYRHHKSIGAG